MGTRQQAGECGGSRLGLSRSQFGWPGARRQSLRCAGERQGFDRLFGLDELEIRRYGSDTD